MREAGACGVRLIIEMHDPQGTLLREIEQGFPQSSIAITYAFCIAQLGDSADWPAINAAIRAKWKGRSLERIKEAAWKHVRDWQNRAVPKDGTDRFPSASPEAK